MDINGLDVYANTYCVEAELTPNAAAKLGYKNPIISEEFGNEVDAIKRADELMKSGYVHKDHIQIVEVVKGTVTRGLEEAREAYGLTNQMEADSRVIGDFVKLDTGFEHLIQDELEFDVVSSVEEGMEMLGALEYKIAYGTRTRKFDDPKAAEGYMREMRNSKGCASSHIEVRMFVGTMHYESPDDS